MANIKDGGVTDPIEWDIDGLHYIEVIKQEYEDISISSGFVEGHPIDTMYLRLERDHKPEDEIFVLLRPDEIAAIAWCANGVLWSELIKDA